jgi:bla regulator protein blaR1
MTAWLAEALFASSLLMVVVLLIRRPVANQFGPRVAYCLWLIPALRMVLPPLPESWLIRAVDAPAQSSAVTSVAPNAVDWIAIALILWAAGAALHFTLHLWSYRRFAERAIARADFLQEVDPGAIEVFATPEVSGPLAMGLTKPSILVPTDFHERYDVEERASALAHEVAHHRRGDLKVNLGALALLSLHWFNPLAHIAYRAFRVDQELACDAMIMAGADADSRHAYGRALVKSACDAVPLAACALDRKQELKRRLKMMQPGRLTAFRSVLGGTGAVGLLASGMMLTATAAPNQKTAQQPGVRIAKAEMPVAPVAPAAPLVAASFVQPETSMPVTKTKSHAHTGKDCDDGEKGRKDAPTRSKAKATPAVATGENQTAILAAAGAAADAQRAIHDAERATHDALKAEAEAQALAANDVPVQVHLVRSIVLQNGTSVVQRATYLTTDGDMRTALIKALEDAGSQVNADEALSAEARARALQAIETKIAKIKSRQFPIL